MHSYQLKSIALLHKKSGLAVTCATAGNLTEARSLFDEIRFLRAVFIQNLSGRPDALEFDIGDGNHSTSLLRQVSELNSNLETIDRWLSETKLAFHQEDLVTSLKGIDIYLDTQIPPIWNWLEDLIILPDDPGGKFSRALAARGQSKVIVLAEGQNQKNIRHISKPSEATAALSDWQDETIGRQIFIPTSKTSQKDEALFKELKEIFISFLTRRNTKQMFSTRWALQQIENLATVVSNQNIADLEQVIRGRKCVIVSPGPSLKKNISLLEGGKHEYVIIAVAQACPALMVHNIYPDFVVVLDPLDYSYVLKGVDCSKIPGLIISDICHPAFYQKPFQNIFTYHSFNPPLKTAEITGAKAIPIFGGSVTVTATYLAAALGASEVSLIGSDLAFEEEIYYGFDETQESDISAQGEFTKSKQLTHRPILIPGYFGGEVNTKPDYLLFKRELEEIAVAWGDLLILNNCTEGGAYIEGFNHIPLVETITNGITNHRGLELPKIHDAEINKRLKKLEKILTSERLGLNQAKTRAQECLQLASKLNGPNDRKLATLNKKEKKLSRSVNDSEPLDIFCNTDIASIQRQILGVNSFEGNINLSKSMYTMIIEAVEVLRASLSKQIIALKQDSL